MEIEILIHFSRRFDIIEFFTPLGDAKPRPLVLSAVEGSGRAVQGLTSLPINCNDYNNFCSIREVRGIRRIEAFI
jgi:hypothetical protein